MKRAERDKVRISLFHGYGPVVGRNYLGCIGGGAEGYSLVYAGLIHLFLKVCRCTVVRLTQLIVVGQVLDRFLCYLLVEDMCMYINLERHRAIVIT